jgi:mono/diheme cytochrome c family protein
MPRSNNCSAGFRTALVFLACMTFMTSLCNFGLAQNARPSNGKTTNRPKEGSIARGKYIVEGVAMCGQCHTPRDAANNPDRSHWLEGASVWLRSAEPVENWPLQAPRLAGNPPGTDEEMVRLLTTGIWRDGRYLRPPMPQFRMNREDAQSVIAYLKSLNGTPE